MKIFGYEPVFGCLTYQDIAADNPLDQSAPLMPTYSTMTAPPTTEEHECARYLDNQGRVPPAWSDGSWVIHPDWRDIKLWSMTDGKQVYLTEPNITPDQINATTVPYPGPGYVWRDGNWSEDQELQYQLAEKSAEMELTLRLMKAKENINSIQPAIEGGYAKQEDIDALPHWQKYCYELPDVRSQTGWPTDVNWPDAPQ